MSSLKQVLADYHTADRQLLEAMHRSWKKQDELVLILDRCKLGTVCEAYSNGASGKGTIQKNDFNSQARTWSWQRRQNRRGDLVWYPLSLLVPGKQRRKERWMNNIELAGVLLCWRFDATECPGSYIELKER